MHGHFLTRQLHSIPHYMPPRGGISMRYSVTLPRFFQPRGGKARATLWESVVFKANSVARKIVIEYII